MISSHKIASPGTEGQSQQQHSLLMQQMQTPCSWCNHGVVTIGPISPCSTCLHPWEMHGVHHVHHHYSTLSRSVKIQRKIVNLTILFIPLAAKHTSKLSETRWSTFPNYLYFYSLIKWILGWCWFHKNLGYIWFLFVKKKSMVLVLKLIFFLKNCVLHNRKTKRIKHVVFFFSLFFRTKHDFQV